MEDFFEKKPSESKKSLTIDWSTINNYKKEGSIPGLCMALAESHKLLDYFLDKKAYPGRNIYEKVKAAKDTFSDLVGLANAMDTAEALFDAIGVPRQVVIDHQMGPLEIDALAGGVGGDEDLHVFVLRE